MKRLALALAILCAALPAHANVLVVTSTSNQTNASASAVNMGPFFDGLNRALAPGQVVNYAVNGDLTLAELRDSVRASASVSNPVYNASLIISVDANPFTPDAVCQLSKSANRPRVPVLYLAHANVNSTFQSASNESLGTTGNEINIQSSTALATGPAGYVFPVDNFFYKRGATGAYPAMGSYVTPVLWLAGYNYSKSDPDGVGGSSANDTLQAWFYNPPDNTTKSGRMTAGFGCIGLEDATLDIGVNNFSCAALELVALGMAKRLAPDQFVFPFAHLALDIDDGAKRYQGVGSVAQVNDYLAGVDSLNTAGIPFTLGVETDSLLTTDSDGQYTRAYNELAHVTARGLGRVTVHNHRGITTASGAGGVAADTSSASVSGGAYADIFGVAAYRPAFGYATGGSTGPNSSNQSVYGLLNGATAKLRGIAGARWVSRELMPPTDDWSSALSGTNIVPFGSRCTFDSLASAFAAAGYSVVRDQYAGTQYNFNAGGGTGGIPYGVSWALPNLKTVMAQNGLSNGAASRILFAPSSYLVANPPDTTTAQPYGTWRALMNQHIGKAIGNSFNFSGNDVTGRGFVRDCILVTHCPNWRQASGASSALVYGGGRAAWEDVRVIHGAIMAAKWAVSATGNAPGPMEWTWSDQITERDIR